MLRSYIRKIGPLVLNRILREYVGSTLRDAGQKMVSEDNKLTVGGLCERLIQCIISAEHFKHRDPLL